MNKSIIILLRLGLILSAEAKVKNNAITKDNSKKNRYKINTKPTQVWFIVSAVSIYKDM